MVAIKSDNVTVGEHVRRFNAEIVNEVYYIMVDNKFDQRNIKIIRRDNTFQTTPNNHSSYDALQYPLIFSEGGHGYQINIKQRTPSTDVHFSIFIPI